MAIFDAIGAIAGAGGDIFGSIQGGKAAKKAAKAQARAAKDALELQRRQYYGTQNASAPYRDAGTNALLRLSQGYGLLGERNPVYDDLLSQIAAAQNARAHNKEAILSDQLSKTPQYLAGTGKPDYSVFQDDPGYQFRLNQGLQGVERSAAARGLLGSGRTLKALNDYAQGAASQEFGNSFNRLASLAGIGQAANSQNAAAGQAFANNSGNLLSRLGDARASSYINSANALNQGIGSAARGLGYGLGKYFEG